MVRVNGKPASKTVKPRAMMHDQMRPGTNTCFRPQRSDR